MTGAGGCSYSVLQEPWWWDATALHGWEQVSVEVDGQIVARWPFVRRRVGPSISIITSPPLTNRAGPWISPGSGKQCTQYARSGELLTKLIEQLPDCHWFVQNLHSALEYWIPLHWCGFQLRAGVSYVIDDCSDPDVLHNSMSEATRRQLKKAKRQLAIEDIQSAQLIDLIRKTFKRQGKNMSVSSEIIESVMEASTRRKSGRAIAAVDGSGTIHSAALFVWDATQMYYLIGGGNPELRSSGAGTFALWNGLSDAGQRGLAFDFEGSMMPNIERFFRGFGARYSTYLSASRGSPFMRLAWSVVKSIRK